MRRRFISNALLLPVAAGMLGCEPPDEPAARRRPARSGAFVCRMPEGRVPQVLTYRPDPEGSFTGVRDLWNAGAVALPAHDASAFDRRVARAR